MLDGLRKEVCAANRELALCGLVPLTWGNASGIDRASGSGGHQAQRRAL